MFNTNTSVNKDRDLFKEISELKKRRPQVSMQRRQFMHYIGSGLAMGRWLFPHTPPYGRGVPLRGACSLATMLRLKRRLKHKKVFEGQAAGSCSSIGHYIEQLRAIEQSAFGKHMFCAFPRWGEALFDLL